MAKFNWDRVRSERIIERNGAENIKNEREIYFSASGNSEQLKQISTSSQKLQAPPISYVKSSLDAGYLICPQCRRKIRKAKLQKHIKKVHNAETQKALSLPATLSKALHPTSNSTPKLEQSKQSQSKAAKDIDLVEILVGYSKDKRVRLPASLFKDRSGQAIINGITYEGKETDKGRCKVGASAFGAKSGQKIYLTRQRGNIWVATVDEKISQEKTVPRSVIRETPLLNKSKPTDTFQKASSTGNKATPVDTKSVNKSNESTLISNDTKSSTFGFPTPFSDKILRNWLFESFIPNLCPVKTIDTVGSGPFEESDLDEFFDKRGVTTYIPGETTELLVIGRHDWDKEDLEELLDMRNGKSLKVYSQEMFLAYWMTGCDPYEDKDIARRFADGHSALEFLSTLGFDWVNTFVDTESGNFNVGMPSTGVLKHLGYSVGKGGKDETVRQQILMYVFSSNLPVVESPTYMKEWGAPKSKERLQKMANSIAAFCRNEKRKFNSSQVAITDWENDLDWLKRTFYTGRFMFQWSVFAK